MPKEKLTFTDAKEYKKFRACAASAGVTLAGEAFKSMGEIHQEINYRSGLQLIALGEYKTKCTDKDIEEFEKRLAKKTPSGKPSPETKAE